MRIIAGELRGRRIDAPAGTGTRPMLDRVREALFGTLQPWMERAVVLDLFAGSGSLGFEALSRGASRVRFVEHDPDAARLIRKTAARLEIEERVDVVRGDALEPSSWGRSGEGADVVFFDPPYGLLRGESPDGCSRLRARAAVERILSSALAEEGILVVHAPPRLLDRRDFPDGAHLRERRYGSSSIWYVQPGDGE